MHGAGRDGVDGVMPRYLFETAVSGPEALDRVGQLAAERFPELEVEHSYVVHGESGSREVWVCRAPSRSHLVRWAAAAGIRLEVVRQVDADVADVAGSSQQHEPRPGHGPGRGRE